LWYDAMMTRFGTLLLLALAAPTSAFACGFG
jgi:hypothetical protein